MGVTPQDQRRRGPPSTALPAAVPFAFWTDLYRRGPAPQGGGQPGLRPRRELYRAEELATSGASGAEFTAQHPDNAPQIAAETEPQPPADRNQRTEPMWR